LLSDELSGVVGLRVLPMLGLVHIAFLFG